FTRDLMDSAGAAEARERVTKWIEQTRQLFSVLPELLVTDTHANERVSAAEKEVERLRRELEDLKRENHQLRGERDDIAQALTAGTAPPDALRLARRVLLQGQGQIVLLLCLRVRVEDGDPERGAVPPERGHRASFRYQTDHL